MNSYRETIVIRPRDCDLNGAWRFSAMLEEMQDAAGVHSTRLGWGREELVKQGVVWVLVRSEVRMERCPANGESVTVETFHGPTRHSFYPRYYVMTDAEGKRLGAGSTLWVLMDLNTRKTVRGESLGLQLPDNRDAVPPMPYPAAIRPLEGETRESVYRAVYTDLDVNQHVNNTRYADWICNQIGTETLRKQEIARMILDYNEEILPDEEVAFRFTHTGTECRLAGWIGDRRAFEIACELRERK